MQVPQLLNLHYCLNGIPYIGAWMTRKLCFAYATGVIEMKVEIDWHFVAIAQFQAISHGSNRFGNRRGTGKRRWLKKNIDIQANTPTKATNGSDSSLDCRLRHHFS